jgi:hypothetical protein
MKPETKQRVRWYAELLLWLIVAWLALAAIGLAYAQPYSMNGRPLTTEDLRYEHSPAGTMLWVRSLPTDGRPVYVDMTFKVQPGSHAGTHLAVGVGDLYTALETIEGGAAAQPIRAAGFVLGDSTAFPPPLGGCAALPSITFELYYLRTAALLPSACTPLVPGQRYRVRFSITPEYAVSYKLENLTVKMTHPAVRAQLGPYPHTQIGFFFIPITPAGQPARYLLTSVQVGREEPTP